MKGTAIWPLKEVSVPNCQCCFLQLTPCVGTELIRTVEALNESSGTVKGFN